MLRPFNLSFEVLEEREALSAGPLVGAAIDMGGGAMAEPVAFHWGVSNPGYSLGGGDGRPTESMSLNIASHVEGLLAGTYGRGLVKTGSGTQSVAALDAVLHDFRLSLNGTGFNGVGFNLAGSGTIDGLDPLHVRVPDGGTVLIGG